jgi:hypothetical protein
MVILLLSGDIIQYAKAGTEIIENWYSHVPKSSCEE